jgi:hypothetical protein
MCLFATYKSDNAECQKWQKIIFSVVDDDEETQLLSFTTLSS